MKTVFITIRQPSIPLPITVNYPTTYSTDYKMSSDTSDIELEYDSTEGYEEDEDAIDLDSNDPSSMMGTDLNTRYSKNLNSLKRQVKEIEHVAGIIGIEGKDAALVLRYFGWNKDLLMEKYMDSPEKVFRDVGIRTDLESNQPTPLKRKTRSTPTFLCDICCDEANQDSLYLPSCPPLDAEKGSTTTLSSMSFVESVTPNTLRERSKREKHERLNAWNHNASKSLMRTQSSIYSPYGMPLFPTTRDSWVASKLSSIAPLSMITPLSSFARPELHLHHRMPCLQEESDTVVPVLLRLFLSRSSTLHMSIVKLWQQKCADDSETANWISANTKECTKCHSTIEKNGGCNSAHVDPSFGSSERIAYDLQEMQTRVLLGVWADHGTAWYSCNRFEEKEEGGKDAQSKSRASLERYLHYYNRFANHEQSLRLDKELHIKTEKKMEEIQQASNLSWIEVQFLNKAVETLSVCRTTLKWTYAMAFYLEKNNFTALFEDIKRTNQSDQLSLNSDLEKAVEDLSGLLESPIEADTIVELRQKVTDKTVV
ncbi:hypothetical protein PSTT_09972 [Puccinia striiformis]|uniref:Uncharacterized protein n=1 Tax=Puccinia striiformis TaxID=27350 RepID=A0A2S4V6C8_9BASI|nr:hypothetical protein PSTT_09972 [Puccinia striiformis]